MVLEKLGFSPSEQKLYMHLIRYGPSYATKLSRDTNINRTNVYEAMDRLVSKGVVSYIIKNNVKWYEGMDPNYLMAIVKQKEDEISQTKELLKKKIDGLKQQNTESHLEAKIFVGKKGLRILFEEMLSIRKPIYLLASRLQLTKVLGSYFELWHKRRFELGIRQKSIFSKSFRSKIKKRKLIEFKFVDDMYTSPTTTIIYSDICLLIQWTDTPLIIKIQNKDLAKSHKNYFDMLWNM